MLYEVIVHLCEDLAEVEEFEARVQKLLMNGWTLAGGVSVIIDPENQPGLLFSQALTADESK